MTDIYVKTNVQMRNEWGKKVGHGDMRLEEKNETLKNTSGAKQ